MSKDTNYAKPVIREIGPVRELTLQTFNKIGPAADQFTASTNGIVIGSLVEV